MLRSAILHIPSAHIWAKILPSAQRYFPTEAIDKPFIVQTFRFPRFLSSTLVNKMVAQNKNVLLLVANGSEEMETVVTYDVLQRAGLNITMAGVGNSGHVTCARGVKLVPDISLKEVLHRIDEYGTVVLPGGSQGTETFAHSEDVKSLLKHFEAKNHLVCAICASPKVISTAGVFSGKRLTSYPGMESCFSGYKYEQSRVVVDGNLITSRGPGTATDFALTIVSHLTGNDNMRKVAEALVAQPPHVEL